MTGMNQVRGAVIRCLQDSGLEAVPRMGQQREKRPGGAVAAVGVRQSSGRAMGFCSYLGQVYDEEKGTVRELYGKRLEVDLAVDIYAPESDECEAAAETAAEVLLSGLPSGLKPLEASWGEVKWDRDRDLYVRQGAVRCTAYFTATGSEESGALLDFELKGVVLPC
ncbi:hypothetical protein KQI82_04920 [Oscillibacter sp. MSJ-2]|uniref:Uncharacterized protein n=1 Tax=Dysosmobacter acutus TaxID=2841504 RepID=A0ABS6F878_9FIRM|nr:hypothetical protein [Dysosmobacter acutus]MBU5626263.1 hypothetical protein [Dysosmobacter acutus]